MGCSPSICAAGKRKNNLNILEIAIFVPSVCVPLQTDLQKALRGLIPRDLADRVVSHRNRIVLVDEGEETSGTSLLSS